MNSKDIVKAVGRRLGTIRTKNGITQEKLALKAGLNRAYVGYIERGERNPSIKTMAKLASVLEVDLHELFRV